MADKRDLYETLGVNKSASKDEIKSAYRKLAKKYHPDNHETGNADKFKEVQEAYDILYDDQKRSAYDQFGFAAFEQGAGQPGSNPFEGGFGFGQDMDLGDIFSSFFGGGFGGQRGSARRNNGPRKGEDLNLSIDISFEESFLGVEKEIIVTRQETCSVCGGTGARKGTKPIKCPTCSGTGNVTSFQNTILGRVQTTRTCSTCHGTGEVIQEPCETCHGKGTVRKNPKVKVKIPAGIGIYPPANNTA